MEARRRPTSDKRAGPDYRSISGRRRSFEESNICSINSAVMEHPVADTWPFRSTPHLAHTHLLPAHPGLAALLPEHGLRRGSVIEVVGASGMSSLVLTLLAPPLAQGSWAAVVGLAEFGAEAAVYAGVSLERLALVPRPGRSWPDVMAALVDAFDLVVLQLSSRCPLTTARRLTARTRERGCVVIVTSTASRLDGNTSVGRWPEPADVTFDIEPLGWDGLGMGYGTLSARQVEIVVSGRRIVREGRTRLVLPDRDGGCVAVAAPTLVTSSEHEVMTTAG